MVGPQRRRVRFKGATFRWPLFYDILKVGVVAALITVQTNLTIAIATGLVGSLSARPRIAGFGTGSRLEYLLIPLVFGLGGRSLPCGDQYRRRPGASAPCGRPGSGGRHRGGLMRAYRAERCPFPAGLAHPIRHRSRYAGAERATSTWSARFYGVFVSAMALYFASQGAGRLLWPWIATWGVSLSRLAAAGWHCAWAAICRTYSWRWRWRSAPSGSSCGCGRGRRLVRDRA